MLWEIQSRIRRELRLVNAKIEAWLSTNAFNLLFLFLYITANLLMFTWGAVDQYNYTKFKYANQPRQKVYNSIARGGGFTLNFNCAIILLLACRLFVTGIRKTPLSKVLPLDKCFPRAHRLVGCFIGLGIAIHVPFPLIRMFEMKEWDSFSWWSSSMTFSTGVMLQILFIILSVFSLPWFRKKLFHVFYNVHTVGSLLFFALLLVHGVHKKHPYTYKFILPGLILYTADRIWRRLQVSEVELVLSGAQCSLKPGKVLELSVPKKFNYRAGQYSEINVPSLGFEWHPFTIASAPFEDNLRFYIKVQGDWTTRLYNCYHERINDSTMPNLHIRIRGPFGAPSEKFNSFKKIILISGGIGATPFAAIAKEISMSRKCRGCTETNQHQEDSGFFCEDDKVLERINLAVEQLYDFRVGGEGKPTDPAIKELYVKHLSSFTMNRTDNDSNQHSNENAVIDMEESSRQELGQQHQATISLGKQHYESRHFPHGSRYVLHSLNYLHSTRVAFLLLVSVIMRFVLVAVVAISRTGEFRFTDATLSGSAYWALCSETVLGLILSAAMITTISLEIIYMGTEYFFAKMRCLDFFFFIIASILSNILSIESCVKPPVVYWAFSAIHFGVFLPIVFVLLAYRMYKSIGMRSFLNNNHTNYARGSCSCRENVPDVNFIWTTRYSTDDEWLQKELSRTEINLHRFVTAKGATLDTRDSLNVDSFSGRPKWKTVVGQVASGIRSGEEVGVFFCGPPEMGRAVRRAVRQAEVLSHLRGAYLAAMSDRGIAHNFCVNNAHDVQRIRRFGSNIRLVFHEENF